MIDAYFFDMDQTLTRSKTEIEPAHLMMLLKLVYQAPVIVVSGAILSQMTKQMVCRDFWYMAQNGNHCVAPDGEVMWINELTEEEVDAALSHIRKIHSVAHYKMNDETIQTRGCQVSFSLVGHDADLKIKEDFDPTRSKRTTLLELFPLDHPTLTVKIGGTTCLDYVRKDGTKGENVKRLVDDMAFEEPIYVGDALFPGGNDETVVGVCETLRVDSLEDTYRFINNHLNRHGSN